MANHASALKRMRQNVKRRARNRYHISTMKTYIRELLTVVEKNEKDKVGDALKKAISFIDRARVKGVIHKNKAARSISRLTKRANKVS